MAQDDCWYCYWGWPTPVAEIFNRYKAVIGESPLEFGPGHIVWSDENFDNESIDWCLNEARAHESHYDFEDGAFPLVFRSLEELRAVPENVRCPPIEFINNDPELSPPPDGFALTFDH